MRNYIILNGKNSNEINGLLIQELPPISKPQIRTEIEEIDGRDGDIVTKIGFAAYDKEISVGLYKDFDINEIIAYFNSEGTIVFSNEPDKYYNYQIIDQIDFERLVRYRTATIRMHCQPFKYSNTQGTITKDASDTVSDEGSNLVLENTAEAPFKRLDPKGNANQQTTTGKNLIKVNDVANTNQTIQYYRQYAPLINTTLEAGQAYTFSADVTIGGSVSSCRLNMGCGSTSFQRDIYGETVTSGKVSITFTPTADQLASGTNFYFRFPYISGTTEGVDYSFKNVMLEKGSTASDYEPYTGGASPNPDYPQDIKVVTGEQTVKITGKNILNLNDLIISHGASSSVVHNSNNLTIEAIGTTGAQYAQVQLRGFNLLDTYYFSCKGVKEVSGTDGSSVVQVLYRTSKDGTNWTGYKDIGRVNLPTQGTVYNLEKAVNFDEYTRILFYNNGGTPVSIGEKTSYYDIQLELGSQASSFEPYQSQSQTINLGSIELAKIGTYQDYIWNDDGTWKIHKEVGKATVSLGTTVYTLTNGLKGSTYAPSGKIAQQYVGAYCNRASNSSSSSASVRWAGSFYENAGNFMFIGTSTDDSASLKAKYNGATIYFVLATPVDEEITDATLIEQLEALAEAHSYKGRTHINATATGNNAPHIIAAEVGVDNESTVTNSGNINSKPVIKIYGSGNIGAYLNDIQILQIALGDEGYITIDTNLMEAYKDTLDNLKNRLVTGDYSKFSLKPGANKIHFSGTVTKYEISKYSRWL